MEQNHHAHNHYWCSIYSGIIITKTQNCAGNIVLRVFYKLQDLGKEIYEMNKTKGNSVMLP